MNSRLEFGEAGMPKINRFEDLKVWQLAHGLSLDVAGLVASFPRDEKYDLCDQMRRSARSVPSDISEGFGRYHFNDKLTFYERARASLGELKNHFTEALGNGYIDDVCHKSYEKRMNEVGYLLSKMMNNIRAARDRHTAKPFSRRLNSSGAKFHSLNE